MQFWLKPLFIRCVCPVIKKEFRHKTSLTKFIANNRTDARKTDGNFTITNCQWATFGPTFDITIF